MYHQPLHPFSSSQREWIAMIPSPLPPYNSSKYSCWLWTHVSYTIIALQGYPTHFIVMLMYMYRPYRPQSCHAPVWMNQSKVIRMKIYAVAVYLLCWMMPHNRMDTASKYNIPNTSIFWTNVYEPLGHRIVANCSLYICLFDVIVI